jgi:hypothetical protein
VTRLYDVFDGCRKKVEASADHMERLNEAVDRFFEDKGEVAPIVGKANSHRTKYVFRVGSVIDYPAKEWGIAIGDVVHCLRSSLDQFIYGVARKPTDRTQFPICITEREWVVNAPAMWWTVPDGYRAFVHQLQPYHRGDVNEARKDPLAILNTLSNLDKHRSIPAIALVATESEAAITNLVGIKNTPRVVFKERARLEKDAVVAHARIVPDDSGLEPKMDMKGSLGCDIAFGGEPIPSAIHGKPVLLTFAQFLGPEVSRIVNTCLTLDT